jgi:pimeloyl-ACP methyl ester carboxylesterase
MWRKRLRRLVHRAPRLHVAGDSGSGPIVVMIHGIASSSVTWQNVVPLLEPTHRVIRIDLLGFGGSPVPGDAEYTLGEHVASLARTITALHLRQPYVLVGHSMGALIAARYAARKGRRVRRLVLVSPPVYLDPRELGDPLDRRVQGFYLEAYRYLREHEDFTLRNAARVQGMLPIHKVMDITAESWTPFVKSLENAIESQTTISDLAAVKAPVEVVMGDFDEFSSPGAMRIVARLRGVTVHRVRGSDHLVGPRLAREVAAVIVDEHPVSPAR